VVGGDRPLAPGELPEQLVGLEELGPLAMQTVESLAIEGLKIQTDMTDQDAPYQVRLINTLGLAQCVREGKEHAILWQNEGVKAFLEQNL
jgi:hypothetical protein